MSAPDGDEVTARLYALPPERFVAARDEEVARARQAGDREGAKRIAGLRRPTVAAWLVNLLAIERPDLLGELLTLGEQLREAQHELRGTQLRELSARRRSVVDALAAQARTLAAAKGRPVREQAPLDEVATTLNAALSDAEVAREVRAGRLLRPTSYAGFGETPRPVLRVLEGEGGSPEPPAPSARAGRSTRDDGGDSGDGGDGGDGGERRTGGRAARLAAAQERLAAAAAELAAAEKAYQQAATALDEVSGRLAEVQAEHASAQAALSRATLRRKAAQRAVTVAARAVPTSE